MCYAERRPSLAPGAERAVTREDVMLVRAAGQPGTCRPCSLRPRRAAPRLVTRAETL